MARHDRSVIDAFGGDWPTIADRVRVDTEAIVAGDPPAVSAHELLAKRRKSLCITQRAFARMAGLSRVAASHVENGTSGGRALKRYQAALAKAEDARALVVPAQAV